MLFFIVQPAFPDQNILGIILHDVLTLIVVNVHLYSSITKICQVIR